MLQERKTNVYRKLYEKASLIEKKEAYEKGYSQGQKMVMMMEKKALDEAREEADKIINDAENVLLNAKKRLF